MEIPDFENYLKQKMIDPENFRNSETGLWEDYKSQYDQMHPESFTARNLFKINRIRRKYPYSPDAVSQKPAGTAAPKPKIIMKPKIK